MKVKIEDQYDFIVYVLAGGIDDHWANKFKERILFEVEEKALRRKGRFDVILDMAGVTDISTQGINILKEINATLLKEGVGLAVCKLEPEIDQQIRKASAFQEKQIFPSIFAAKLELSRIRNE